MSALKTRLIEGLEALSQGDLEVAKTRLGEVAVLPGEHEPISGLAPEAEAKFFELLGSIALEQNNTSQAEDAFERQRELDPEGWAEYGWDEDAWDTFEDNDDAHDDCACLVDTNAVETIVLDDPAPKHFVQDERFDNVVTGSFVDIDRASIQSRSLEVQVSSFAPPEIVETLITVESSKTSIVFEEADVLPEEIQDAIGWDVAAPEDREWDELHVEEVRILKTTMIYHGTSEESGPVIDVPASSCACSSHV